MAKRKHDVEINLLEGSSRPKRQVIVPNYFDANKAAAADRDSYFESVLNTPSASSEEHLTTSTESIQSEIPLDDAQSIDAESNDDLISVGVNERPHPMQYETIISKLNEILNRISAIEKSEAKNEARLRNIEKFMDRFNNGLSDADADDVIRVDKSQLGIPVKTKASLDKLEKDLESDEKRKQVVSNKSFGLNSFQ